MGVRPPTQQIDFNPRSLAGATISPFYKKKFPAISIHAPLRERQPNLGALAISLTFQSTLPCGSDCVGKEIFHSSNLFQSTLPCGSDRKYQEK